MFHRMIQWILRQAGWKFGFRAGLSRGARKAKELATETLRAARAAADDVNKHARDTADRIRTTAQEEADALRAQAVKDGQRTGHEKGYKKGKQKGIKEGRETGRRDGWNQVAIEYGIAQVVDGQAVPQLSMEGFNRDMKNRVWSNIYQADGKWTVRVLVDGERFSEVFRFTGKTTRERANSYSQWVRVYVPDRESQLQALAEAIRYRNSLVDNNTDHAALYLESDEAIPQDADGLLLGRQVAVALEFHRRLQSTEFSAEQLGFLGEDPEDRMNIEDTALMTRPWTVLFEKIPARLNDTLYAVGMGNARNPRSVRDLLLVTPAEMLEVMNFGPSSLNAFRRSLQSHGLALWGDPVPAPPRPDFDPGDRELRAISLD